MKLSLSLKDVQNARPLKEGWYEAECTDIKPALSADKQSVNVTFTFSITDKKAPADKTVNILVNNKNAEMFNKRMVNMIEAITGSEITADLSDYDTTELLKKPVQIHLVEDSWGGIPRNQIDGFLSIGAGMAEISLDI